MSYPEKVKRRASQGGPSEKNRSASLPNSKVSNGERLSAQQNSHMLKHREIKRAVGFCVLLPHDLVLLVIY